MLLAELTAAHITGTGQDSMPDKEVPCWVLLVSIIMLLIESLNPIL